jgi:hypothetical protein
MVRRSRTTGVPGYVAMLRGINVSGSKMEGVSSGRDAFRCLGRSIDLFCPDGHGNTKGRSTGFRRTSAR